jgi:hypothetical protein
MQPSNLCLTCDKETLFDQCPACNPEAFIKKQHDSIKD